MKKKRVLEKQIVEGSKIEKLNSIKIKRIEEKCEKEIEKQN